MFRIFTRLAFVVISILCFATIAFAQPAGGKTTDTESKPKPTSKAPAKTGGTAAKPPRPPASSSRPSSQANSSPASIDGKWWTSGNDFGASEVIFTQQGPRVSGEIHYADGGTGTVNG